MPKESCLKNDPQLYAQLRDEFLADYDDGLITAEELFESLDELKKNAGIVDSCEVEF